MDKYTQTNNIILHYLDHPGDEPPIIVMHGLSANAHFFDGLAASSLPNRLLAVDLRGRGQSDKPATGYSMAEHAADILGLMDNLGLEQVILAGHSYGGLLTCYLAANYPERVSKCIVMDSGFMHPSVRELIKPSLDRLKQRIPSWEAYRDGVKSAAYWQGYWDTAVENYYRADVQTYDDGSVRVRSKPENIAEAVDKGLNEPWEEIFGRVQQPTLMLHAPGSFGAPGTPPVVPPTQAEETVGALGNCRYRAVPGNHMTMLFGENAEVLAQEIVAFLEETGD
ncbi:alpha/beta fold hydrolase [Candidatus Leptofilum sp.]|uniref:alpha/beta fold hydrolase n=1 Tax=Candidatus Leptofilum sp. TaxID=3241576 RepID=UPI003B5C99BD